MIWCSRVLLLGYFASVLLVASCNGDQSINEAREPAKPLRLRNLEQDTGRIKALIDTAYYAVTTDPQKAEAFYRLAYIESQAIDYHDGTAFAILGITNRKFEEGNYDSCEYYYSLAEKAAASYDFEKRVWPSVLLNKGTYYFLKGDIVKADSTFYKGLEKARELNLSDSEISIQLLYNLACTKSNIKQADLAIEHLNEAELLSRKLRDTVQLKFILTAKAEVFLEEGQIDSAKQAFTVLASQAGALDPNDIGVVVAFYRRIGEPSKAIPYIEKGIQDADNAKIYFTKATMNILLGEVFNDIKNYEKAAAILRPTLLESIRRNFHVNIPRAYTALTETEKKLGNYKEAFELQQGKHNYEDSVLNSEKTKAINDLNIKYKTADKNRQLSNANLKIAEQRNMLLKQKVFIIGSMILAFLLIVFVMILKANADQKSKIKDQELAFFKQANEINILKAKMEGEENERQRLARDLHDGIGSMVHASLMQLNTLKDEELPGDMSSRLSGVTELLNMTAADIRKTAGNLMPDILERLGLADAVLEYVAMMPKPSSLEIAVQTIGDLGRLDPKFQVIFYRIIQELLQNLKKHANASEALLQLTLSKDLFSITIEDNGQGFDPLHAYAGKGLRNLRQRIENLGGFVSISSQHANGTTVYIELDSKLVQRQ